MNFTDIFIRRPVFSSALSLMIFLIGLVSLFNLPISQYPQIAASQITVTTMYPGASADLMTGFITTPLENAISGIDNIDYMTSSNTEGQSQIIVQLTVGADPNAALSNIQAKVTQAEYMFPKDAQTPIINLSNATSNPTVFIAFNSDSMSAEQITDYLLRVIQPQIQTLNGVSQVPIFGEREYAMRLNLNPAQMAARNITPNSVFRTLNSQNFQTAAGTVYGQWQQFNVTANTDLSNQDAFNNMVIGQDANTNTFIRIKDIGQAYLGGLNYQTYGDVDGKETVTIGVIPKATANPLAVSNAVEALMPTIKDELPYGLKANVTYDSSIFIKVSIEEVIKTIIEAVIFVIAVMMLFLGSFRAVVVPLVTIPLSIIGVCGIMLALNYSIDTITLLAWVLAIGLVVDDAIVVVENVYRHLEQGETPYVAATLGTREIGFAILAMTFTLATVYAPIGFSSGLTGILFREFAFTLSAAVILSGFIALTLSPMMCSRLLKHSQSKFVVYIDKTFDKFKHSYMQVLTNVLHHYRLYILIGTFIILGLGAFLFNSIPSELAPTEDQGVVFTYNEGPGSTNIRYTVHYAGMLDKIYQAVPEMEHYIVISGFPNGVNSGISALVLIDWDKRKRTAMQISTDLTPKLWAVPGLKIFGFAPPPLPGAGFLPVQFVLKTTGLESTQRLLDASAKLQQAAEQYPGFAHVDLDLKIDQPQVNIIIDRNKAADMKISMEEIGSALGIMLGQPQQNQFSMDQRSYYVVPEFDKNFAYLNNPKELENIYVHSSQGTVVPLSNLVTIAEQVVPESINHFQQLPSVTMSGVTAPGYTLGDDITFLRNFVKQNLPNTIQIDYAGESRQYIQSASAMQQAFIFAILFIFLVLAAQFESYRDPLIVMMTVPLSLTGALFTLRMTGGTMNIYSEIGLITLIGLISKHGILIVEFANQIQLHKHKDIVDSVIESASLRLRPILMTTAAMVLAAIPLAFASGAGAEARHQLGWVIVGGMLLGTLFSLFVVPTVYSFLATKKKEQEIVGEQA